MNTASPDPTSASLPIDPAAARLALEDIERVAGRVRKVIAHGPASAMLMLWGCVWAAGFSITEFAPAHSGKGWIIVDLAGIIGSIVIALFPKTPIAGKADLRVGIFWIVLFLYAGLWFWMLHPVNGRPANGNVIGGYWATVPMFAYVVGGLWLSRFFVYLGLIVTLLTVLGLTLFPAHFNLWMAILGGGSLFVAGVFIRLNWR